MPRRRWKIDVCVKHSEAGQGKLSGRLSWRQYKATQVMDLLHTTSLTIHHRRSRHSDLKRGKGPTWEAVPPTRNEEITDVLNVTILVINSYEDKGLMLEYGDNYRKVKI